MKKFDWKTAEWRPSRTPDKSHSSDTGQAKVQKPRHKDANWYNDQGSKIVAKIYQQDLKAPDGLFKPVAHIVDAEFMASYNWLDEEMPTIIVPGAPPVWTTSKPEPALKMNPNPYFQDVNAAKWPKYPIEPAIRAMLAMKRGFCTKEIDVVTNAKTLINLLEFASSESRHLKLDVEVVGYTVFILRREDSPQALSSFLAIDGQKFCEENTTWGSEVENSISNHRIIQYHFGGLRLLVESECHGFFSKGAPETLQVTSSPQDILRNRIGTPNGSEKGSLIIRQGGCVVPQQVTFSLQPCLHSKNMHMEAHKRCLWAGHTKNLVSIYHADGIFKDFEIYDMEESLKNWEVQNTANLSQLANLLQQIIGLVKQSNSGKLFITRAGGVLECQEQTKIPTSVLPVDLKARWGEMSAINYRPSGFRPANDTDSARSSWEHISGDDNEETDDDWVEIRQLRYRGPG
ncbi:hypothetical protein FQN57_003101 [Myotisia sp. PD_48]|nr:hypothetical protein FQN57_003101 [Myotisia sp. PD_48]